MRSSNEIIDYLNTLRKQQNMSISELARRVGMAKSGVSRYFNHTREFPINRAPEFAKALHVSVEKLLGVDSFKDGKSDEENKLPSNAEYLYNSQDHLIKIPIIGTIACGEPIMAEQNIDGYTSQLFDHKPAGDLFALRCKGHSMEPTIPDGAIVIVQQQPEVEDGEIAAVQMHNDGSDTDVATLKRVKHANGEVLLMPYNQAYTHIVVNKKSHAQIIGKAIRIEINL